MPVTCSIDSDAGIVHTTVQGNVSVAELESTLESTIADSRFRPGLIGLVDLRNCDQTFSTADVAELARFMTAHREKILPSRTAIVVTRPVHFGLARMYDVYAEPSQIETRVFWNMEEARQWLAEPQSA